MELSVIKKQLAMDSRDVAKLTGKLHKNVLKDIEKILPKVIGSNLSRLEYKDSRGRMQPYYQLPYRELLVLLTGYSVELRTAVIDRWAYLEKHYQTERKKSIEVRNDFTDTLSEHGYKEQYHFIQTTSQMKKAFDITHKKGEMTVSELDKITASEALAKVLLTDEQGYYEVNPICVEAAKTVKDIIEQKSMKHIA